MAASCELFYRLAPSRPAIIKFLFFRRRMGKKIGRELGGKFARAAGIIEDWPGREGRRDNFAKFVPRGEKTLVPRVIVSFSSICRPFTYNFHVSPRRDVWLLKHRLQSLQRDGTQRNVLTTFLQIYFRNTGTSPQSCD